MSGEEGEGGEQSGKLQNQTYIIQDFYELSISSLSFLPKLISIHMKHNRLSMCIVDTMAFYSQQPTPSLIRRQFGDQYG